MEKKECIFERSSLIAQIAINSLILNIFWDDTEFINRRKESFIVVGNVVSSPRSQKEKKSYRVKVEVN